ncbi:MAG: hypothetical protein U1E57_03125 [Paenacidovorax caeni]
MLLFLFLLPWGDWKIKRAFDVLIDAFSSTKKTNARLVIFGSGSLRDVLQAQIDSLNMGGAIVRLGIQIVQSHKCGGHVLLFLAPDLKVLGWCL